MEHAIERTIDVFVSGGPVMWPLLAMSVLAAGLGIERMIYWLVAHRAGRMRALGALRRHFAASTEPPEDAQIRRAGALYRPCIDALVRMGARGAGEATEAVRVRAERYGGLLSLLITGAPLLGILGTVLGIIQSFGALGETTDEIQLPIIAAGIAQALVTTAFGLIVALIALVPYALVRSQAQRALGQCEAMVISVGGREGG